MMTEKPANLIQVIKGDLAKLKTKGKKAKGEPVDRSALWAKIGFACAILSAGSWYFTLLGLPLPILGLVFSIVGLRTIKGRWCAVTGLTLSIIFLNITMIYIYHSLLLSMLYGG
jgi:hypothetical protein